MEYLTNFIQYSGYFGYGILFLIIFFESFPPTFFLPGDSLLFITGFFASQGYFNLALLVGILFFASVLGYIFSYAMGEKLRTFILQSNDKYWFKKKHLDYTEEFYKKYGNKTLVIGRFVPIVRSFSPTLAGAVKMDYNKFLKFNLIGGFLWTGGMTTVGFYLGKIIPNAEKLLTPIVLSIIFVSLIPTFAEHLINKIKKTLAKKNPVVEKAN
ncbi:MAG: DedA family protein [bacterium]